MTNKALSCFSKEGRKRDRERGSCKEDGRNLLLAVSQSGSREHQKRIEVQVNGIWVCYERRLFHADADAQHGQQQGSNVK